MVSITELEVTPKWLDNALHDAAMAVTRVKASHFARKYRRIKARSGHSVAIGAVKHAMLTALYHMLNNGDLYRPPTPNPAAERTQHERTNQRLIAQFEKLGHSVMLGTATSTAPAAVAP
jgi:hypothetical protein